METTWDNSDWVVTRSFTVFASKPVRASSFEAAAELAHAFTAEDFITAKEGAILLPADQHLVNLQRLSRPWALAASTINKGTI